MSKSSNNNMKQAANDLRDCVVRGDCLDVMRRKDFPLVDLVHTSPPYNIDKPYENYTDKLHLQAYLDFIAEVAELLHQRMRVGASLFWQTGYTQVSSTSDEINPIDVLTYSIFKTKGFYLKDRIIWRYLGGMSFKSKFKNQHETIYWYVKGNPEDEATTPYFDVDEVREKSKEYDPRNNLLGRNPGNVWEVDRVAYGSIEQTSHIAVFPEELTERIVRACSKPGDLVFDPFLGSGTTAKVAKSLGRNYLGTEMSEAYYRESLSRLGFQQFGEADTVLSEFLKSFLQESENRADKSDCASFLRSLLKAVPDVEEKRMLSHVAALQSGREFSKPEKPVLWQFADAFLDGLPNEVSPRHGILKNTMVAYLRNYKLAKWFNGLRLALISAKINEEFERVLADTSKTRSAIDRIVAAEPSSFETKSKGDAIVLKQTERRVKASTKKTGSKTSPTEPELLLSL